MTTTSTTPAAPAAAPAAPSRGPRPVPFLRLVAVELRKQTDTRAGRWLLAAVVLLSAGLIALHLVAAAPADLTWQELTLTASFGQVLLLPLLGIMAATAEWSQRTALTTFVLEPRRTRVHLAKLGRRRRARRRRHGGGRGGGRGGERDRDALARRRRRLGPGRAARPPAAPSPSCSWSPRASRSAWRC